MKKFKQFKSEQQHITEMGPIAGALMGVLGLATAGWAGYKGMKKGIKALRGIRYKKEKNKIHLVIQY